MRKNFSPAVWHRQENVFATSCSFLFSSLPVFLVFSWVTKIETKVERREEEKKKKKKRRMCVWLGCAAVG
jgi:aspartyl/asparaginyl beta-hydroxylase (cupin superfamily)